MSANLSPSPAPERPIIAWLLLRDGHAVPIAGLSPDDLKAAREATVQVPGVPLKHTTGLNAIVHELGFDGDFGDYQHRHWPRVQALMNELGLNERADLFTVREVSGVPVCPRKATRRRLADRVFLGGLPASRRVFLGYGIDWAAWDDRCFNFPKQVRMLRAGDEGFRAPDIEEALDFVLTRRMELLGQFGFIDDALVAGPVEHVVDKTYHVRRVRKAERDAHARQMAALVRAWRLIWETDPTGWVELIPVTDRLVLLRAGDGSWDVVWRNLRDESPPADQPEAVIKDLSLADTPACLLGTASFPRWNYMRRDAWDEKERHEAEQHYYDRGGDPALYPGFDDVLAMDLADRSHAVPGKSVSRRRVSAKVSGFQSVRPPGTDRSLHASGLVTIAEFSEFVEATGYAERRTGDDWVAGNGGDAPDLPVAASWLDALAYCAWKERALKVPLRLLTVEEHRALRPFASEHYAGMARADFPWENWPPRFGLQPSVTWSEPRFLEAGPEVPEFPPANGLSTGGSRKRWIENWPPRATWASPIPWAEHAGLRFIDAWDAHEWCQEAWIAGRYWEGEIGASSWGAYKNSKVGFRLVVDQEVEEK